MLHGCGFSTCVNTSRSDPESNIVPRRGAPFTCAARRFGDGVVRNGFRVVLLCVFVSFGWCSSENEDFTEGR